MGAVCSSMDETKDDGIKAHEEDTVWSDIESDTLSVEDREVSLTKSETKQYDRDPQLQEKSSSKRIETKKCHPGVSGQEAKAYTEENAILESLNNMYTENEFLSKKRRVFALDMDLYRDLTTPCQQTINGKKHRQ